MEIRILFQAVGSEDVMYDVADNFGANYPEFSEKMEPEICEHNDTNDFTILWIGDFELSKEDEKELIRLTHHAEGFYEGTDAEYVHVEVCINGTWYGRNLKEIKHEQS